MTTPDPATVAAIADATCELQEPSKHGRPLTKRENEIAVLLSLGHSDKKIALALGGSDRTVEIHVGAILKKLGVRRRSEVPAKLIGERDFRLIVESALAAHNTQHLEGISSHA